MPLRRVEAWVALCSFWIWDWNCGSCGEQDQGQICDSLRAGRHDVLNGWRGWFSVTL